MKTANRTFRLLPFAFCLLPFLFSSALAQSPEAGKHVAQARAAESRNDWVTAESEYLKALELAPNWVEAVVNLGIVYNRQGATDKAIAAFTRATQINPQLFSAQLNLAITYFRAQRFQEALMPLRRALALEPASDQAARLLILALFARENYEEVTDLTEKLLLRIPDDRALLEIAGRASLKLRRYEQALRLLERLAKLPGANAEVYLLLGEARDNTGDSEGAIEDFHHALRASGATPLAELNFALGYVLWKLRRYDQAEVAFRRELERDSTHARSIYYLGNIALSRGDWAKALPLLERAVRAMPEDFAARYDFGKTLLQANETARAIQQLQAAIRLNGKHSGTHYQLALALKRLNRDDEAQREFALARELNKAEREELEKKVQGEEQKKKP